MNKFPRPLCNPFIVCEHAWHALEQCKKGVVIECGVFDGCTSAMLNYILRQSQYFTKQIACDTFEGMPYDGNKQELKAKFAKGWLTPANKVGVISELQRLGIEALVGKVEDTLPRMDKSLQFAFVFLDLDLEQPTKFCAEYFKDKILPGGRIGFHDYDENPKYALAGIASVVRQHFVKSKAWKEVIRAKKRDGRFIFFERV